MVKRCYTYCEVFDCDYFIIRPKMLLSENFFEQFKLTHY